MKEDNKQTVEMTAELEPVFPFSEYTSYCDDGLVRFLGGLFKNGS